MGEGGASSSFWQMHGQSVYRAFKYTVYSLLSLNVLLFFQEDYLAAREVFGANLSWSNLVEGFSATIDTAAWVTLLLLFELETAVISDEKLKGNLKWYLLAVRTMCYSFIVYAFYGYCAKYGMISRFGPAEIQDACSLIDTDFTYVHLLDEYFPIDIAACQGMQGHELVQVTDTRIIGTRAALDGAVLLAIVDIINAADWLVIVVLLEIEVYLQLHDKLSDGLLQLAKWSKGVLYAVLLACAAYWGFEGDFLDFWDAFLWLVAFIFIEMNIFDWHAELVHDQELAAA